MNDLADRPRTVAAGDTEEGVLDVAAGGQLLSDHRGGIGGDREPEPDAAGLSGGVGDPGDRGVDAEHLPGGIAQPATGGARVDGGLGPGGGGEGGVGAVGLLPLGG